MRIGFSRHFLFQAWLFTAFALPTAPASAADVLLIETKPTHSRITLKIDESVEISWKENSQGFELLVKRFSPEDIGLEEGTRLQNSRARIEIRRHPDGTMIAGSWRFPAGEEAPDEPKMETFRFRDHSPSRYLVDFWVKAGPTVRQAAVERALAHKKSLIARAEERARKRVELHLERERKKEVGADLAQYCKEPLTEDSDVFLRFQPVHIPFDISTYIPSSRPDRDYAFLSLQSAKPPEGEGAKAALELFLANKPGLAVRAIEIQRKEHPKSALDPELRFLLASVYWRLGQEKRSEQILRELARTVPDSAPGFHAMAFLARRAEGREDYLSAYESYQALIRRHPDHKLTWIFHMAAAEALFTLRQTERGLRELQWVSENAPTDEMKAEGAYRIGDFHLQRGQYAQALAAYFKAANSFPAQEHSFPSTLSNRAEAFYWLGEMDRSADAYASFLEKYSGNPSGWRAAYRLGEIYARKAGSSPSNEKARGYFMETVNRFPTSQGAVLARIRLLPCGDHGGFDNTAAQRFFLKEAMKFDGGREVATELYGDFLSLAKIRTFVAFAEREEALAAIAHFSETRAPGIGKSILDRYFPKLFRATIEGMLDQGRVVDALDIFQKHSELYRKNLDSLDMEFLLRLAARASDFKLGALSQKVAEFYRETSKYGYARGIASNYDEGLRMERQLEKSEERFIEARALWQKDGKASADRIRELLAGVLDESPYSAEREIVLGLLTESEGKLGEAAMHALRARTILPARFASVGPRLIYWTAELQAKSGKGESAIPLWKSLEGASAGETDPTHLGLPAWGTDRDLILRQAEVFEKARNWKNAALAYDRLVKQEIRDNRVIYGLAKALERSNEKGQRAKARKLLEEVAGSKQDDFWKRLATESLAGNGNQGG